MLPHSFPLPELLNHHLDPATWGRNHKEPPVGQRPDCNIWIWNGLRWAWKQLHALRHRLTPRREACLSSYGPGGSLFSQHGFTWTWEGARDRERAEVGGGGEGGGGEIGAKQARGWERLRERRKREGRHLNKTRSKWCLHDKGARHLPWLVSQRCTKAMQAPRCGVMCGAQACLCIQGVILGRNSRGPLSSFGMGNLCAYPWKEKKFPDHLFFLKTVLKLEETRMGGELMDTSSYAQLKMLFSAVVFFLSHIHTEML